MSNRNTKRQIRIDIDFIDEMLADVEAVQKGGDAISLKALAEKLTDWKAELSDLLK
ncbi:hypothetical protein ACI2KR_31040 [Pseudomonas luteola]